LLVSTHRLTISGVRKSEGALFFASCDWAHAGPSLTIPILGPKSVSCFFSFGGSDKFASTSFVADGAFAVPVARAAALRDVLVSVLAR
jgi:hypothetical protein